MTGLRPGEMRDNGARWTDKCPKCGQEIEERTFDQGNVWVHIKTSPQGNQEISEKCFAPDPERMPKVGEMVTIRVSAGVDPWRTRELPAVVTRTWPDNPLAVELTIFSDDGPLPKVLSERKIAPRGDAEASESDMSQLHAWKFLD